MKKKFYRIGIACSIVFALAGCTRMLGDIFFSSYCLRCKVTEWALETPYWSSEECGGGKDELETECKAAAYEQHRSGHPNAVCECETYRAAEEE